jgi:tripartite-type tricarboxylate transporter receptor subunit TctC
MGTALKQPLVVLNKPGGSYAIGVSAAAMAPADGYTMLTVHIGLLASQASMRHFDLFEAFTPIGMIGALPTTVTVGGKSRFKSVADLVAFGKANPGKVNFSTPGLGTVEHLKSVQFANAAGFKATHIPYKGGPEMVMSLINGEAHFSLLPNALAEPFVRKGQLRYIAPLSDERMAAHPEIPTAREQGVNIESMVSWMGFMVRKGTPQAAIDALSAETTRAMQSARIQERFLALGALPTTTQSPQEFGARMRSDLSWMSRVVSELNLKLG